MNDIGFKNVLHDVGDISSDIGWTNIVYVFIRVACNIDLTIK